MNLIKYLFLILFLLLPLNHSEAASLASKLSGKILLNVEENGEAWYVYPEDSRRYFLGRPADAFAIMRELGLGISENNFQKLVKSNMPADLEAENSLSRSLSGKIILQIEKNGEAWYVNPDDFRIYYLGRPADAFKLMRELSLGISRENLALIHKPGLSESIDGYSRYEHKAISTSVGDYTVDLIEIDLDNPDLEIITDTANTSDCDSNCPAKSLGEYVLENDAFAGINGSYFEAYSGSLNYYFAPVYNSREKKLLNEDQIKYWTTGPVLAFDTENNLHYFKDSREFGGVEDFEEKTGKTLQAAISNKPRLVENGLNQLVQGQVDSKQEKTKAVRNAICYREGKEGSKGKVYLLIVQNATLLDLAEIVKSMGYDLALNLDGGYSAALWYNDEYMVKPGRDIPNAIVFKTK